MKKNKILALGLAVALTLPVLSATDVQAASWQKNNTGWWWLEDDNSYPVSEWKSIYGKWYYFDSNGYMLDEGWHWIGGKCYYMYSGGAMASNTWIGDSYVDASGAWLPNAKPAQWMKSNNRWWYRHADGSYPANTWEAINGSWYYFDKDGWMLDKGWHWINGKCYYMYSGGAMASNTWIGDSYVDGSGAWVQNQWKSSENRWWYCYADGSYPASAWKYIDGFWYYFDKNGWMLDEGWHWIDGNCYYMYAGGAMASNTWIGDYWVDETGKWISDKRKAIYSYEVYSLKPFEKAYSGCIYMIYIKTDNPAADGIAVDRASANGLGMQLFFADVDYTYKDNVVSLIEKVDGGYLVSIDTQNVGKTSVKIYENSKDNPDYVWDEEEKDYIDRNRILVDEFEVDIEDYSSAEDKYMDKILAEVTTPEMSPVDKMRAVSWHLLTTYNYYTCFKDENGERGRYAWLLSEPGPWWVNRQLNSFVSPALLCQFAEKIGGFENIHNCYYDYPYGTPEWYREHYKCRATYQGEEYEFWGCPSKGKIVDKDNMEYVSFTLSEEGILDTRLDRQSLNE